MRTIPSLRLLAVIAALLAWDAGTVRARPEGAPPAVWVLDGEHFRLHCYFDSRRAATEALVAAEAAWAPTVAVLGAAPELDGPIEIHLLRDTETYKRVERALTNGRFERNNAFSSWDTRAAYVSVEPAYSDALLARIGLTAQTRRTVAHEAAHLIVYHAWPSFRKHPTWLAEGIAIWAADQALVPAATPKLLGSRPFASQRIALLRKQAEEDTLPDLRDVVAWDRYRDLGFSDKYAFWWGFFRYLYTGPRAKAFRKVLSAIGGMPTGGAFKGALLTAMSKALGDEDGGFDELRDELKAFAAGHEPTWDEPWRTLDVRGRVWWQLAFADSNAICWRRRPAGSRAYAITGTLEIQPAGRRQMNVLLGRVKKTGFISVAYRAGEGVTLLRYDAKADTWSTLAEAKTKRIAAGRPHRFAVHVAGKAVRALLDGVEVVRLDDIEHPLDGAWGIGVQAGGAGAWTGVRLESGR